MGYTNKSKTKYKLRGSTDGFYRDKNGRLCLQKEKITPVEEKTLFQKGSFDDGYQFGDITKAILGTTADAGVGILKGAGRLVEGVVDLGGYGVAEVADLFGADKFADNTRKAMQVDTVGEMTKGIDEELDKYSLLGYYGDAVAEGAGQILSIIATGGAAAGSLGALGATALTSGLMGASSMGSGIGEAYQNNATDGQAWAYGAMKGAVDMASEWIFGGLGKGVKALGLGKGLTSIDDVFARKVSGLVTKHLGNETAQKLLGNTVEYAIKSGAEGLEEVLAGIGTAYAKKFSYMSEKDINELKKDENLLEQFIVGSLTSAIAQGGDMFRTTTKGQDFITGRTASEQKALDAEVNRLTELYKKNGEKVKKSEIYDEAEYRLKKGYIGTDTIESIIGEKAYSEYKKVSDAERAETERLNKEISSLEDKINSSEDISSEDRQKLSSLRSELESLTSNSKVKELKEKLDTFVRDKVKGTSLAESYNEIARQTEKFKADLSQYTAKEQRIVQKAIDSGILNNTNRSHELVDLIAKLSAHLDIDFDFVNNQSLKESGFAIEGKTVNGYITKDGITINTQSPKYLNSVIGHEITHVLKDSELFDSLQSTLFDYAKSRGEYDTRLNALTQTYKGIKNVDINEELTADLVGDYIFTDRKFVEHLLTTNRGTFQKIYDELKYLCKIATTGSKEEKALLKAKKLFEDVYNKGETNSVESTNYSTTQIIGNSGKNYGIGVYLDSSLLTNLSENDRKGMVKEKVVTEFAGKIFAAYDKNGNRIDVKIANRNDKIKKSNGKKRAIIEELYKKNNSNIIKQESVVLSDELIQSSKFDSSASPNYSHDWLDNYGKNDWEYWKVFLQEKNKTVWEATLNIANTANGEKILYDIDPIIKVEGPVKSVPTTTTGIISDSEPNVNRKNFLSSDTDIAPSIAKEEKGLFKSKTLFEDVYNNGETDSVEGVRYNLSKNAKTELHKALYDTNYEGEVLLRDISPEIMTSQKGVKNLPMSMNASHIRENVFTKEEAKKLGLSVNSHTHYHGLGENFYLEIIDGLDNVKEAYRGTKTAEDSSRRENYFLLISEFKDKEGNTINVPVYIDETASVNRVYIDVNKISTVFGRENFRDYINNQIQKKNLVRIKNRSIKDSESNALIARDYVDNTSNTIIRNSAEKSTGKLSLSPIAPEIAPNGTLEDVTLKTPLNDTGTENILGDDTSISEHNTYSNYENSTQVLNNQNKNDIINSTEKPFNTEANEKETYTPPEYETFETRKIVEHTDMQTVKKRRADATEQYGLTSDEATRLERYVGGQMCYMLNKRMLNGTLVDGDLSLINSIRNALLKMPEYSGRTYRNLQFNTEKKYNDFLSEYSEGNVVKLKAFTSTSKLPNGYTKLGNGVVHLVIDGVSGRDIADTFGLPRQQEVIYLPETKIEIKKVMIANDGNPLIFAQEVKTNENVRRKETGNTGDDGPETSVHQDIDGQGTEFVRDGGNNSGLSEEVQNRDRRDGVLSQRGKSIDSGNVRVDNGQTEEKAKENTTEKNEDTKQIDDYTEPITQTSSNGDVFFDGNTATLENDNTVFDAPTKEEVNEIEETTLDNKCISSNMSDAERSQILKSKKLENIPSVDIIPQRVVESISNDETIENISSWEDINKYFGSEKRTLIQKIASEFGVFKDYNNSDINIEFTFSRNDYRESYGKQKHNFESFAKMFSVFDKVVENAIGIEVHNRNDEGYKPDVTLKNSYVLISAFSDGDLIYPVKLEVKEFSDKKNSLYVAISLEAIKKTEVSKQGTTENGVAQNSRSVNISIADLMQKVNPKNTNFTKYFPEEILTQEQKRILKPEQNTSNSITVKERSFANTAMESDIVGGKILHEDLSEIAKRYVPTSNETTLKSAGENLANEGYEKAAARLTSISESNSDFTLMDIAESELLLSEALRKGDTKTAGEIIENLAIIGTELGQKVQALSLINRMTPEGQLRMLEKIVKYNQKNISKKSDKAPRMRDKSFAGVKITEEIRNTILSVYKEDGTFDQNALNEAVDKAKQMIADQMSVSYKEKLNAWRYLSMLGNPKTHLRNTVSNVAMTATIKFKDALARTIESVVPIKNRTKTWKRSTQAVKEFAKQTTEEMESVFKGEGKYGDTADIKSKRKIFDTEILQKVYGFNSDVLTGEDVWFKRYNFNRSLSEFLTANGIETAEDIKNNPELVEKGKRYALEQAEIATFQQHSALASEISKWSNRHDFLGVGLDAILPFKKTPINIAKAGLNYSPLGFAKTIAYDIPQLIEGNINASKFIDDISQNITGTGLMLLGYALASLGFLNGAGEDDEEGKFDYQLGEQSYSVAIGDNTYSLDWLSPVAMPLFVGANAFETFNRKEGWSPDVVIEALAKTADPLSEMSILSSLDEVLSSYSGGTQRIGAAIGEMGQSYVGQYIPTILSQTAATFDDVKRTTKASSNSGFTWLEETARAVMYKIPGLRNLLEPSIDIWGNEIKQNENFALRAIENFASVTSRKQNISSDVSNELKNLFNEVGESGILPSIPKNLVTYKGEQYAMSAKEYTDFKKEYGQQAYNMLNELFNTSTYKNATFEQKAKYVDDVYTYARENAKKKYFETKEIGFTNSSRDNVPYYKENSIKSAIENDMTPEEYEYMTNNPEKHAVSLIFGSENFAEYKKGISKIEGDRDKNGNTINGSAKEKRIAYINSLNLKAIEKKVLFKSVYPADNTFNKEIVEYILELDMKTEEKVLALKGLGFKVDKDGNIKA